MADASATLAFCPLDGGSDEFVDLRQQGQYRPLQTVGVERIDPLGRHPELESNGSDALNAAELSHSAAGDK